MRDVDAELSFSEFEKKHAYLLPWEKAEEKIGHKLDWNNNYDCCLYHDLLVETVNDMRRK